MKLMADPYASRVAGEWEAVERRDPVVYGDRAGPLSANELRSYAAIGFHFVPGLFSPQEVETLREESSRIADSARTGDPEVILEPDSGVVRSVFRLHRTSEVFRSLARDSRIADVARQVLGSDVYVHQSRANFKPAFDGREFFWHSDFETWHIEDGMPRMRALSVSIALTELNEFNGPLMVVPGSHHHYVRCIGETPEDHYKGSLRKQQYGVPSREALEMLVKEGGITAPKGPAGSALFFECNVMHGSSGNLSPFPRAGLFLVYNSVENGLVKPFGGHPPRPEFLAERDITPL